MHKLTILVMVAVFAFPAAGFAQQRPLQTEDPETIGSNRILLEGGVEIDRDQTNAASGVTGDVSHIATFGASIGISPYAEVQIDGGLL